MASDATPPPPADEDSGPMLLAAVMPLFAVSLIVYIARIWTRLCPKYALTAADYTITVAMVQYIPGSPFPLLCRPPLTLLQVAKVLSVAFMTIAIQSGFGKHMIYMPNGSAGRIVVSNHVLGAWMTGVVASGFARISIAALLLRITPSRRWKALLWTTIAIQILYMVSYEILQLVQCRNTFANKARPTSQCLSRAKVFAFSLTSVAACMLSDFVCAAAPLFIIWRLSRSTLEKALVMVLMASCLVSTACGIPRIYYLATYDFGGSDPLWSLIPQFFWCKIEEGIIIIAACVPLLKGPIERVLERLGMPTFRLPLRDLNRISSVALGSKEEGMWEGRDRRIWSLPSEGGESATMTATATTTTTTTTSLGESMREGMPTGLQREG
jgi:hypothetical protein